MKTAFLIASFVGICLASLATAGPVTVTYSSYLTDAGHKPRSLSGQLVYFRLYTDSTSTTPIWQEQHGVIAPNGFISVALGSITPLPLRQIGGTSSLWLEMKIVTDPPFPRQKIATSFFAIAANYADSARHAVLADSAKRAARAVFSDTAQYARGGSAVVSAQKADSAGRAGNADSLGGIAAGRYVRSDASGNVGIGTESPQRRLHILGSTGGGTALRLESPGANASFVEIWKNGSALGLFGNASSADSNIAVVNYANANLQFWTNSSEKMRIEKNGNVGIGMDPNDARLSVAGPLPQGHFIADAGNSSAGLVINRRGSGDGKILFSEIGVQDQWCIGHDQSNGDAFTFSQASTFGTGDRLVIQKGGNVGIGTTTPGNLLSLCKESDNAYAVERFERKRANGADVQDGDVLGALDFHGQGSSNMRHSARIEVKAQGNPLYDTTPGKMSFFTTPSGSSQTPVERMVIDKNGNVGIGTTNPQSLLQVGSSSASVNGIMRVVAPNSNYYNGVSFYVGSTEKWFLGQDGANDDLYLGLDATRASAKVLIDSGGNVGIGTSDPKSKLHVTGLNEYANNAAALAAGLTAGAFYRNGDVLMVVH